MEILSQFLLRLTFGLAFGMAITSPRKVSSGFFRNHLYVTLGLATLAAFASRAAAPGAIWFSVGAAVASYIGSVCWLYEKELAGRTALLLVFLLSFSATHQLGAAMANHRDDHKYDRNFAPVAPGITDAEVERVLARDRFLGYASGALGVVANISSGLLLGFTTTAMLLGHWYLNSPGMQLAPLRKLILATGAAVIVQAVVSALGLLLELHYASGLSSHLLFFILLRWSFGLVGVAGLLWMAHHTLEVPNTQSATGILYVAVIAVFVGELTAALLSAESAVPL